MPLSSFYYAWTDDISSDVLAVRSDLESMKCERAFTRFIRAKQHSGQLHSFSSRLRQADASFSVGHLIIIRRTAVPHALFRLKRMMLTSVETHGAQILTCVRPLRGEVHRLSQRVDSFFYTATPNYRSPHPL